jgi:hypothetical protein
LRNIRPGYEPNLWRMGRGKKQVVVEEVEEEDGDEGR